MKNKFNSATFLASICLPGLLLLGPFSSAQQPIPGSTLKDFFDAAIKYSPELRISAENLNISTARKDAAQGRLLPRVSAGANVSDNRLNQLGQRQTFDGQRYYLGLTQTLFIGVNLLRASKLNSRKTSRRRILPPTRLNSDRCSR